MNAIDPFSLEEMLSKIIQGQSDLEAAQQAQQELIQPVNTNLLNEGQGFKGLWSDPTDNQRQGILQTGLSLLSTHDTNNLSQRIGQAIGQGMSSIREGRELDQKRQLSQSGLDIQRLQGRQQHNQAMAGIGIQLNQQQIEMANRLADIQREERHRAEDRTKVAGTGNFQYIDSGQTKQIPFERTADGLFVAGTDTPLSDALTPEQLAQGIVNPKDGSNKLGSPTNMVLSNGETEAIRFNQDGAFYSNGQPVPASLLEGATVEKIGRTQHDSRPKMTKPSLENADLISGSQIGLDFGLDVVMNPALESVVGPLDISRSSLADPFIGPEGRSLKAEVENFNASAIISRARALAPVTEVDTTLLERAFGIKTNLKAPEIRRLYFSRQAPTYFNVIQTRSGERDGLTEGLNLRMREVDSLINESLKRGVTPEEIKSIRKFWLADASPEARGQGYMVSPAGKLYTSGFINNIAVIEGETPETIIRELELTPY